MKNAYLNPYSPRAREFLPRNRADWSRARLSAKFAPEFWLIGWTILTGRAAEVHSCFFMESGKIYTMPSMGVLRKGIPMTKRTHHRLPILAAMAGADFGVAVNGNLKGVRLTLTDVTITSDHTGVYFPADAGSVLDMTGWSGPSP